MLILMKPTFLLLVPQVSNGSRYPHMLSNLMAALLTLYSLYVSIFYNIYIPEKYFHSSLSAAPTFCNIVHIVFHNPTLPFVSSVGLYNLCCPLLLPVHFKSDMSSAKSP